MTCWTRPQTEIIYPMICATKFSWWSFTFNWAKETLKTVDKWSKTIVNLLLGFNFAKADFTLCQHSLQLQIHDDILKKALSYLKRKGILFYHIREIRKTRKISSDSKSWVWPEILALHLVHFRCFWRRNELSALPRSIPTQPILVWFSPGLVEFFY